MQGLEPGGLWKGEQSPRRAVSQPLSLKASPRAQLGTFKAVLSSWASSWASGCSSATTSFSRGPDSAARSVVSSSCKQGSRVTSGPRPPSRPVPGSNLLGALLEGSGDEQPLRSAPAGQHVHNGAAVHT